MQISCICVTEKQNFSLFVKTCPKKLRGRTAKGKFTNYSFCLHIVFANKRYDEFAAETKHIPPRKQLYPSRKHA